MAAYGERGYIEADILTDILASGRSSRYYRQLLMADPLFTEVDASIAGSEEPGFLMLRARLSDASQKSVERARTILTTVASECTGITDRELTRAVNRYESNHQFSMLSYLTRAQELALSEMHGEDINSLPLGDYCRCGIGHGINNQSVTRMHTHISASIVHSE